MNTTGVKFTNTAGKKEVNGTPIDDFLSDELKEAGIEIVSYEFLRDKHPEVKTAIQGQLHGWTFQRAWYYWMCKGPGINNKEAEELHAEFGKEVRVDGHCGCPSPTEWYHGLACGHYHVDTQRGLNALAKTIRDIVEKAKKESERAKEVEADAKEFKEMNDIIE